MRMTRQLYYSLFILSVALLLFVFKSHDIYYEHDMKYAFELDGCKVYRFKSFDGRLDKMHYFTNCKGNSMDQDEINYTEVEKYEERGH